MITSTNGDSNLLCFYGTEKTKKLCPGRGKIGVILITSLQWQLEWDYTGEALLCYQVKACYFGFFLLEMFSVLFAAVSTRRSLSLANLPCRTIDLILMISALRERYTKLIPIV